MTKVYIFDLKIQGEIVGTYGAFDDNSVTAQSRVEGFFKGISPAYHVEASLRDVLSTEDAKDSVLFKIPVFDRRKTTRAEVSNR